MNSKRGSGRIIAGLIVIAVGVLFLLGTLDVVQTNIGEVLGWIASILLLAFGLGILIARRARNVFFPIVLIGIGLFILLGNLGVDAYVYWPVILILIGGAILFGGRRRRKDRQRQHVTMSSTDSTTTTDSEVNVSCTLGEVNERVESAAFTGGAVNITIGNVNLDLRDATVVDPPARLEVSLTMAGLSVRVPADWDVEMDNVITMGEAEDKRARTASTSGTPHLVISGKVTMGNLTIND